MARKHMHRGTSRRLAGNLCDVCVNRLLEISWHHRLTGRVRITSWGHTGAIEFQHGEVKHAHFRKLHGDRAMDELANLRDGIFEMVSTTPISLDVPLDVTAQPANTEPVHQTIAPEPLGHEVAAPVLAGHDAAVEPMVGDTSHVDWRPARQPAQQTWPQPAWTPQIAQPTLSQPYARAESVPMLTPRLPALRATLGFSLLGLTLLVMVASQL